MRAIKDISPATYRPHALHGAERQWGETNCSVDLWIELLHALGRDPVATLGVTALLDFEGDQFTFFKLVPCEVEALTGVRLEELSLYDDLLTHFETQIARGRVPLVEVDAWNLPDTRGVSYGVEHSKTTIGVNALDRAGRRIEYFHNAGYFALEGEDFDAIFARGTLFPYCEYAKVGPAPPALDMRAQARAFLRGHVSMRPAANPIAAWGAELPVHAQALAEREEAAFHKYAFNTFRMLGANFELMADHLRWLDADAFAAAADEAQAIAEKAKIGQFQLARIIARKRMAQAGALAEPMIGHWDRLFELLGPELG